jgi:hypothetical protein
MDITKKELRRLKKEATLHIENEAEAHGLDVEDRIYEKLERILTAKTAEEAKYFVDRVKSSHNVHCLVEGKRTRTVEWYQRNSNKARSLAKSMMAKGEEDEAERHLARAKRYDSEAVKLAGGKEVNN